MIRVNPFNPGSPVNPGMFVGRLREIDKLEAGLAGEKTRILSARLMTRRERRIHEEG